VKSINHATNEATEKLRFEVHGLINPW